MNASQPVFQSRSGNNHSTNGSEYTGHFFTDQQWLAVRQSQMDMAPNCIFPARDRRPLSQYLQSIRMVVTTLIKLPVRL